MSNDSIAKNLAKDIVINQLKIGYALEEQIGGEHYKKYAIQPIEFVHKNNIPAIEASAIKYIVRHKDKNGAEDIKKAIHVLKILLELEYPDADNKTD